MPLAIHTSFGIVLALLTSCPLWGDEPTAIASDDSVKQCISDLHHSDSRRRVAAAEALAKMAPEPKAAIPALIEALGDQEAVHDAATRALVRMGREALPALSQGLLAKKLRVRSGVVYVLYLLNRLQRTNPALLSALAEALQNSEETIRQEAAQALSDLGPEARGAVPALVPVLGDRDPRVASTAARALGKIRRDAASAVPALIRALDSPSGDVRLGAALALADLGPLAVPATSALSELVRKEAGDVGLAAIRALGEIGPEAQAATPTLMAALQSKQELVRLAALRALVAIRPTSPVAIQAYLQLLGDEKATPVAVPALCDLGPRLRGAVPELIKMLLDANGPRVLAASTIVRHLGRDAVAALPVLMDMVQSQDVETRVRALIALRGLGADARPALPAIRAAVQDPSPRLSYVAAVTLSAMEPSDQPALAVLRENLKNAKPLQRIVAAGDLWRAEHKKEEVLPVLLAALQEKDRMVRCLAIEQLVHVDGGRGAALRALHDAIRGKELSHLNELQVIEGLGPTDPEWLPLLNALVHSDNDFQDRHDVLAMLSRLGPRGQPATPLVLGILAEDLHGPLEEVTRVEAEKTLQRINPQAAAQAGIR